MNYGQAQAKGIPYKAWLYLCEQEEIEREQEEEEADREFFAALTDPNSRLARAFFHLPEVKA